MFLSEVWFVACFAPVCISLSIIAHGCAHRKADTFDIYCCEHNVNALQFSQMFFMGTCVLCERRLVARLAWLVFDWLANGFRSSSSAPSDKIVNSPPNKQTVVDRRASSYSARQPMTGAQMTSSTRSTTALVIPVAVVISPSAAYSVFPRGSGSSTPSRAPSVASSPGAPQRGSRRGSRNNSNSNNSNNSTSPNNSRSRNNSKTPNSNKNNSEARSNPPHTRSRYVSKRRKMIGRIMLVIMCLCIVACACVCWWLMFDLAHGASVCVSALHAECVAVAVAVCAHVFVSLAYRNKGPCVCAHDTVV